MTMLMYEIINYILINLRVINLTLSSKTLRKKYKQLEMICVRKHFLFDKKYTVFIHDQEILIGEVIFTMIFL
jgi:hypothetical protein